jgi:hypothetical protein
MNTKFEIDHMPDRADIQSHPENTIEDLSPHIMAFSKPPMTFKVFKNPTKFHKWKERMAYYF